MKKTQFAEIKNLAIKSLYIKANEMRKDMSNLKLKKDAKDIKSIFLKRRDLAKVLTVLRQKQLMESLKEATK